MRWLAWIATAMLVGCGNDRPVALSSGQAREPHGAPPPVAQSANVGACHMGKLTDPVAQRVFPADLDGFCLDTKEGNTIFGDGGKPLKGICDPFDGECDVYFSYGIDRLAQARYVATAGSAATIEVNLSEFASSDQAFGMFTKRTVGDSDPADDATPKVIDGGGAAALGVGNAYLWRGRYLAELTYVDTKASEQETHMASDKLLPGLVKAMGDLLDGDKALPAAVSLVPLDDRLPMGVRLQTTDALGIKGAGPAAFGYHKAPDGRRFRTLAMVRSDEALAKSAFAALTSNGKEEPGLGDSASDVTRTDGKVDVTWVFVRKGTRIFGLGDEARVLRAGIAESAKLCLTTPEKIERLKKIIH
jgi:hypothetical protein